MGHRKVGEGLAALLEFTIRETYEGTTSTYSFARL